MGDTEGLSVLGVSGVSRTASWVGSVGGEYGVDVAVGIRECCGDCGEGQAEVAGEFLWGVRLLLHQLKILPFCATGHSMRDAREATMQGPGDGRDEGRALGSGAATVRP